VLPVAFVFVACSASAADWNAGTGGNPQRNSLSAEVGPRAAHILWQGGVSAIVAQPAVIEGNVVAMSRITNLQDTLNGTVIVAHDLDTGQVLWPPVQLPISFPDAWRNRVSAIRDGHIYATRSGNTNYEYLYALSISDGAIVWQSQALINESSTESVAFTANGDIIAGNFTSLVRINKDNGTTMWSTPRSCPTSGGCEAAVYGERAYIWEASPFGPKISVFNVNSGAYLFSGPGIGGGFVQQLAPLVGPDGTVYAPRSQNNVATDFLVAYEDTGTTLMQKWSVPLGFVPFASLGVGPDGSVYSYLTTMSTIEIVRRNPANGVVMNTSGPLPMNFPAQPRIAIDAHGRVFFTNGGFSQGRLFSFNANLTPRWSVAVPNVNIGGPALGMDGTLVVCGVGTDVRAFRTLFGDFDLDDAVALDDYAVFAECMSGPNAAPAPMPPPTPAECLDAFDADNDQDIDLLDFAEFQSEFTGLS
jgi:outer membrane protein assembly factor BamB